MNIGWNIMMCGCKHTFRVSWGLGHGVRGASGHGTLNIGWNIMMCGCKDAFRVSWGLGQGVRGLGVRGASGHGTPLGFPGGWDKGLGDLGLGQGVRGLGVSGAWEHGTMNIGWQHPTTERYKHCPLQPTQNGAVTSDTNPDRYKRPPRPHQRSFRDGKIIWK